MFKISLRNALLGWVDPTADARVYLEPAGAAGHASHENQQDQSHWGSHTNLSYRSIGIENVGTVAQALEDAQYQSLIRLIQDLTTMSRYHRAAEEVSDGLPIPKWSWHGRVDGFE